MPRTQRTSPGTRREWSRDMLVFCVFCVAALVMVVQLLNIQLVNAAEVAQEASDSHMSEETLTAARGTIYDRNGEVLATNVTVMTIWTDPTTVDDPETVATVLADVLGEDYDETYDDYYALVTKADSQYAYIQQKVDVELADALEEALDEALGEGVTSGIYYTEDTKRVYPYGETGSQVIGNVNSDGEGIAGLELEYGSGSEDDPGILAGTDGEALVEVGKGGLAISDGVSETIEEVVDGLDIVTSLDIKLQEKAESSLLACLEEYEAVGGNVMVMDAATGEIYAACSYAAETDDEGEATGEYTLEVGKLASITDAYEPGSTFKALTALSVLANDGMTASDTWLSVADSLEVYDATISDSHDHETQDMTLATILAESSNVGIVLASRTVDTAQLYATYAMFGCGTAPATDFPGVAAGQLEEEDDWDGVQEATITFGQGMTATNAQLIAAYGAIEQRGTMRVPHFVTDVPGDETTAAELALTLEATALVADADVCDEVAEMLCAVVEDGTGTDAAIEGFTVAGKTGTAQIAEGGTYGDEYNVSFIGWLEGSSSDLICAVTVNEPDTDSGGGPVCGPVFADIMSFAIECYKISPDAD